MKPILPCKIVCQPIRLPCGNRCPRATQLATAAVKASLSWMLLPLVLFLCLPAQAGLSPIDAKPGSGGISPKKLTVYNNKLYFSAYGGSNNGVQLWESDGTVGGTKLVTDIVASGNDYTPVDLTVYNNKLYFSADNRNGLELWESDGTAGGTKLLKDINNGDSGSSPADFTVYNNKLYFSAYEHNTRTELWESDGTTGGTKLLKDIKVSSNDLNGSSPGGFTVYNNKLYFRADDGINGSELWESNGTAEGTKLVKDIQTGRGSGYPIDFAVYNNKLYFSANDGINGFELWESDSTAEGTKLVKDIWTGNRTVDSPDLNYEILNIAPTTPNNSYPTNLTVYNSKLYFQAKDGTNGSELWESDGTAEGTKLVKDIRSGSGGSDPAYLTVYNNKLYFSANNGDNGNELWESAGTAEGTKLVKDIRSGSGNSDPADFTVYNDKLYFGANDGINGYELWALSPLQVTDWSPAHGATGVAANISSLSLTFNETITAGAGNIVVRKAGVTGINRTIAQGINNNDQVDSIDVTTSGVTINGQTATISLLANVLSPNTGYYVTVPAGAFTGAESGAFSGLTDSNAWTFTTGKSNQTVAFDAATPTSKTLGDTTFNVTTTASSDLTPTLGSSTTNVCTVSGSTVTLLAAGTCTLTVNQEGNDSYNAAAQVTKDITVNATTQDSAGSTSLTISRGHLLELEEVSVGTYTTGKPSGMEFALGSYSYRVVGLNTTIPETITITLTFASPIPTGAKLYKVSNTGYTEITGAILSGNTATFSITDNGSLDTNPTLGTIDDPVALGAPAGGGTSGGTASSGGGGNIGWLELLFAFSIMGATLRRRINVFGN